LSDLSEADLREADLSYACVRGEGASLKGANLLPFNRKPAMFSEHNLNGAAPGRVNWRVTNLQGADLSEADLSHTHLTRLI